MTKKSNIPPPTIPEKPWDTPHILFNAPWPSIGGGLKRSGREADLSHLHLAARLIMIMLFLHSPYAFTDSSPHVEKHRTSHLKRGKRDSVDEKKGFVEFNMAK
jgi:hypothetical protein